MILACPNCVDEVLSDDGKCSRCGFDRWEILWGKDLEQILEPDRPVPAKFLWAARRVKRREEGKRPVGQLHPSVRLPKGPRRPLDADLKKRVDALAGRAERLYSPVAEPEGDEVDRLLDLRARLIDVMGFIAKAIRWTERAGRPVERLIRELEEVEEELTGLESGDKPR